MLTVCPQDFLSAAAGEGRKCGRNTEWKLKSDQRDGVVSDKLCIISVFSCILMCIFLYNFGVCTIWQFLLLLRSLKKPEMTMYNFVMVFCVMVWLCCITHTFRHNRKAFLNTKNFVVVVCWVSHLHETAQLWQQSWDPTFIHQFFEPVAYVDTSRGSMFNQNWASQVNCTLAEGPGVYLGNKYFKKVVGTTGFWKIFIYIIQNELLLSYQWNIWISLISKVRNARCML